MKSKGFVMSGDGMTQENGVRRRRRSLVRKQKSKFLLKCMGRLNSKLPKSERWFREKLEDYGLYRRFKKNVPIFHLEVIPDLCDREYMIVIEVDGSIHKRKDVAERDAEKDKKYKDAGYTVFRVIHGDEEGAYRLLDTLVNIYRYPSKKQLRRVHRKIEREKKKNNVEVVRQPISIEAQSEAIKRILGPKKIKPGKFYE